MKKVTLTERDQNLLGRIQANGSLTILQRDLGDRLRPYVDLVPTGVSGTWFKATLNEAGRALKSGQIQSAYTPVKLKPDPEYKPLPAGGYWRQPVDESGNSIRD